MSLVELLLASMIAAVIGLAAATVFQTGIKSYLHFDARGEGTRMTNRGLDFFHDDMNNAISISDKSIAPSLDFELLVFKPGGTETELVRYHWSGTPGDPLERDVDGANTVVVLDKVETFDARWLWTTRTAYALENESVPLAVSAEMPVYIFDENRNNYKGALALSAGSDSTQGIATLASGGYALATRGGTGAAFETGPFSGGDVYFSWEAPDTIDGITDVSLWMKKPSTTGSFLDTAVDLEYWSGDTGIWTAGDDLNDGFGSSVIYPASLRTLYGDPMNYLLRVGTERFRAWVLTFKLWADDVSGPDLITHLDDKLTADFSKWAESPVPNAGYFLRDNPVVDDPMNMCVVVPPIDTSTRFLLPSDTRSLVWGDYECDFDLWMPKLVDTRPLPDSRTNATMHFYSTDFGTDPANAVPAGWQSGAWADFKVRNHGVPPSKKLLNDTSGGHAIWRSYADTAFWSDTAEISFDLSCDAATETFYVVVYSPDSLYTNQTAGQSPKGAIVIGIKFIDEVILPDKLRLQAYVGNGYSPLIAVGGANDIGSWVPGVTNRLRFWFHNGTLKIYNSGYHPTDPQFTVTGFSVIMPTSSNYYGLLHARGGPIRAWQLDNFEARVTRTRPGAGGTRENGVIFSDDFETTATGKPPREPGWYEEMTGENYFEVKSAGGSTKLEYKGGDVNTFKPLYYNHSAWNSARPETLAVELDIKRSGAAASGQAYVILATPGFHPGDGNASRYTRGVRMVRIQALSSGLFRIEAAWGTGSGVSVSSTHDATHATNAMRRYRFEMDGRTLKVYQEGALIKTWSNIYPDHIVSYTGGFDGMDNTRRLSYDRIAVYHGGWVGLPVHSTYLLSRFQDSSTYYRIRLWEKLGNLTAQAEEIIDGTLTVIDTPVQIGPLDSVDQYTLTIDGSKVELDGPDNTLTATHRAGLTRGAFGFQSSGRQVHYDNIKVKTINGEADFIARYGGADSQIIVRYAVTKDDVHLRIVRKTPNRETILGEAWKALKTKEVRMMQVQLLPTDTLTLFVDTGSGLRQVLSKAINNDIPAGPLGFSQGTTKVNFDDFDCTTTAAFSPHIVVELLVNNTTSLEKAAVSAEDLTDTWEEFVFSFGDENLDPSRVYLFRIYGATVEYKVDGSIDNIYPGGPVTADILTFLPVNYSGSTSPLDENHATYGITGASNAWQLRYTAYNGPEIQQSNVVFHLWDEVILPVNGRIVRQERVKGGLLYDVEVRYGDQRLRYAGGATSAMVR